MADYDEVEITERAELRAWLEAHHEQDAPVWLVRYKKHVPDKHVAYDDIVEELICFGWIDSQARRIDADRASFLISPRRAGSPWSAKNKRHVESLEARDLIAPPGRQAIERAHEDGSWTLLDDVEALIEPPDLIAALDAEPPAREHWDSFPPSLRRGLLWWIKSARRDATRTQRISRIVSNAAQGLRTTP